MRNHAAGAKRTEGANSSRGRMGFCKELTLRCLCCSQCSYAVRAIQVSPMLVPQSSSSFTCVASLSGQGWSGPHQAGGLVVAHCPSLSLQVQSLTTDSARRFPRLMPELLRDNRKPRKHQADATKANPAKGPAAHQQHNEPCPEVLIRAVSPGLVRELHPET